jgi:sugar transferase (PEP-CTERM/EpsH1 system associated)
MKILFVVPYAPNRVRVRSYSLIRALAARGHDVTLLAPWVTEDDRRALEGLRPLCSRVAAAHLPTWRSWLNCLGALPTQAPLQAAYSWSGGLARTAVALAEQMDVVHVEHLRASAYALSIRAHRVPGTRHAPIVWDSVDCISLLFRQAARHSQDPLRRGFIRFETARTERDERRLPSAFEHTLVTSKVDRQALLNLSGGASRPAEISVLPNGVDLEYFRPAAAVLREPATLVLSGKLSYHANVAMVTGFVRQVLPLIRMQRPDVRVCVVGRNPSREVVALGDEPGVDVAGTVPDLRPYLQRATVALAPIPYGVGIQNKVLEAMACATPVVASPQAASALEAEPGRDFVVADGPRATAEEVLALLGDPSRRAALGWAGRHYVESYHDWGSVVARLEETYHEVIRIGC